MRAIPSGLSLLLLAGAPALAQQAAAPRLPFNPFAEASEGDWMVFEMKVVAGENVISSTIACKVARVTDDEVTLRSTQLEPEPGAPEPETQEQTFSRKEPPDLSRYVFDDAGMPIEGLETSDEARELGEGKRLDCKLLSFAVADPADPAERVKVKLWISPQVRSTALVGAELRGATISMDSKVLGWGTAKETGWGKTVDQVKAELARAAEAPRKE